MGGHTIHRHYQAVRNTITMAGHNSSWALQRHALGTVNEACCVTRCAEDVTHQQSARVAWPSLQESLKLHASSTTVTQATQRHHKISAPDLPGSCRSYDTGTGVEVKHWHKRGNTRSTCMVPSKHTCTQHMSTGARCVSETLLSLCLRSHPRPHVTCTVAQPTKMILYTEHVRYMELPRLLLTAHPLLLKWAGTRHYNHHQSFVAEVRPCSYS